MLSKLQQEEIKRLYENGNKKKDIAAQVGCSLATVTKYTKDLVVTKDEMTGQIFGQLKVLERAQKDPDLKSRCLRYKCECSCGKIIEVNGNSLRTGHTTSCGCSRKGTNVKNLINKKFGLLTVLELQEETSADRRAIWSCQCECGKLIKVPSNLLLQGKVKSCGCLKESVGELSIKNFLEKMMIDFKQQYRIQDCKNIYPLPFDFAIFENEKLICLIEYQGDIHYKVTGGWNDFQRLLLNQERDKIKREYCKKHNIKLIEISYTDYDKINTEYLRKLIYE